VKVINTRRSNALQRNAPCSALCVQKVRDMAKPDELAKCYDSHDTSAEMEAGHWVTEPPESDPMITTSLRLPKSLLDRVRVRAAEEDMKATAWIRALIEGSLSRSEPSSIEARVRRLEAARFSRNAELSEMEPVGGGLLSMDEIVEAVRAARGEAAGSGDQEGIA
jgi:hypothetical protein